VLQAAALAGRRIVALGERGSVVWSDDDGLRWRQARSVPVSVTLTALGFAGDRTGWAVGHGGVILHTRDAGESWSVQADGRALARLALEAARERVRLAPRDELAASELKAMQQLAADGPLHPLLDIHVFDAQRSIVVGAYNLAFETRDGGATWRSLMPRLPNPKGLHLYAVQAVGDSIFIVGEQGLMLRSRDGGASFEALRSPYAGTWFSLATTPEGELVVAGLRGHLAYSADQGDSWSSIAGSAPVSFVRAVGLGDGRVLLANQAGQLATSRKGAPPTPLPGPALPPPTDVLSLPDGALCVVGLYGVLRLPRPDSSGSGSPR
jgi:photosystem II stability/assembly factor-like uncharacterized protein